MTTSGCGAPARANCVSAVMAATACAGSVCTDNADAGPSAAAQTQARAVSNERPQTPAAWRRFIGCALLTAEAGRIVAVALAVVDGLVRVGAQRPGAIRLAGGPVRGNHAVRCRAVLDPGIQRSHRIKGIRPRTAPAVHDPRRQKQAREV